MSLIGNLDDFPDNSTHGLLFEQLSMLVVRHAGQLFIYENNCPHTRETLNPMGGSLTTDNGMLFQCQRHAAQFLPATGECVAGPCQGENLTAIPFTLSGGDIYLD